VGQAYLSLAMTRTAISTDVLTPETGADTCGLWNQSVYSASD